jgi:hypothetical protein
MERRGRAARQDVAAGGLSRASACRIEPSSESSTVAAQGQRRRKPAQCTSILVRSRAMPEGLGGLPSGSGSPPHFPAWQPQSGYEVRTSGLLRGLQNVHGSTGAEFPCKSPLSCRSGVAAGRGRFSDSPRELRSSGELGARETPHFAGPFPKRLMGFEPTTFCMASRTRGRVWATTCLQTGGFSRLCAQPGILGFHGDSRQFED